MKEFNMCQRSHDESLKEIIKIKNEKKMSDTRKANKILDELA